MQCMDLILNLVMILAVLEMLYEKYCELVLHFFYLLLILKGNQSSQNQIFPKLQQDYNYFMSQNQSLFFDLVQYVQKIEKYRQIFQIIQSKYCLSSFRFEIIEFQALKKLYKGLQNKYLTLRSAQSRLNSWCEHQRKLYVWFIMFYIYRLEENNLKISQNDWKQISRAFYNKNIAFLMFEYYNLIKLTVKISWAPEQDVLLLNAVKQLPNGGWYEISNHIFIKSEFEVFKSPKHCRQRFLNHLDQKKKRGNWTSKEDLEIFKYVSQYGKRWCKIVPILKSRRTEHMIKNRYNSLISKFQKNKKDKQEIVVNKIVKSLSRQLNQLQKHKNQQNLMQNRQIQQSSQNQNSMEVQQNDYRQRIKVENMDGPSYLYRQVSQEMMIDKNQKDPTQEPLQLACRNQILSNIQMSQRLLDQMKTYQIVQYQVPLVNLSQFTYGYNPSVNYYYNPNMFSGNIYY